MTNGVAKRPLLWSRRSNIGNSYSLFYTYYSGGPNDGSHYASFSFGVAMITSSWSRSSFRGNHDGMEFPNMNGNAGGNSSSIEYGVAYDHSGGRGVLSLAEVTIFGLLGRKVIPTTTMQTTSAELPLNASCGRGVSLMA